MSYLRYRCSKPRKINLIDANDYFLFSFTAICTDAIITSPIITRRLTATPTNHYVYKITTLLALLFLSAQYYRALDDIITVVDDKICPRWFNEKVACQYGQTDRQTNRYSRAVNKVVISRVIRSAVCVEPRMRRGASLTSRARLLVIYQISPVTAHQ